MLEKLDNDCLCASFSDIILFGIENSCIHMYLTHWLTQNGLSLDVEG